MIYSQLFKVGIYEDLRIKSLNELLQMDESFSGYAMGYLAVGEKKKIC